MNCKTGQTIRSVSNGVEGEEEDYLVKDGLLGHDFVYDKFFSKSNSQRQLKQVTAPSTNHGTTPSPRTQLVDMLVVAWRCCR